jgi:hypothetical protein
MIWHDSQDRTARTGQPNCQRPMFIHYRRGADCRLTRQIEGGGDFICTVMYPGVRGEGGGARVLTPLNVARFKRGRVPLSYPPPHSYTQ